MIIVRSKGQEDLKITCPFADNNATKQFVREISSTNKNILSPAAINCRNTILNRFGKTVVTISLVSRENDYDNLVSYTYST